MEDSAPVIAEIGPDLEVRILLVRWHTYEGAIVFSDACRSPGEVTASLDYYIRAFLRAKQAAHIIVRATEEPFFPLFPNREQENVLEAALVALNAWSLGFCSDLSMAPVLSAEVNKRLADCKVLLNKRREPPKADEKDQI